MFSKLIVLAGCISLLTVSSSYAASGGVVIPGKLKISGAGNGLEFPDGTIQTSALSFPYTSVISTFGNAFDISNGGSGSAISGTSTGSGPAGHFTINNNSNSLPAVYSTTNGTGPAVNGYNTGSGNAGLFEINNPSNDYSAVNGTTNGGGSSFYGNQTGTGNGAYIEIVNNLNNRGAVVGTTTGTGGAGGFFILNPSSNAAALNGYTVGTGPAGKFIINNPVNTDAALYASTNGSGNAATFEGNVSVLGTLTKSSGSFKIDHPIDPRNKYLYHSFVESPDMMNIYNGTIFTDTQGYATIMLPVWFEALNREFRYQLTILDEADTSEFVQAKVVRKINGNYFTIRTSSPNTEVSWQVTGIRHDPYAEKHRIHVEVEKASAEKGSCLHSEACEK